MKPKWDTSDIIEYEKKKIYPDIIIYSRKPTKEVAIIADVKYMETEDFGESQLYQIAFYLNDYKEKNAYALIPDSEKSKEISWNAINQGISIHLVKIPINEILDIIYSNQDEKGINIKNILNKKIPIFLKKIK